jgi:hypothetical protein
LHISAEREKRSGDFPNDWVFERVVSNIIATIYVYRSAKPPKSQYNQYPNNNSAEKAKEILMLRRRKKFIKIPLSSL